MTAKATKKNSPKKVFVLPEDVDYVALADKILPELLRQILSHRKKYTEFKSKNK